MLEDKIKAFKITKIEGNLQSLLNTCVENLLYNILINAKYVLEITNRKIIKVGHLRTINYIQKKSIGIVPTKTNSSQKGGFAVLPSEYFGNESGSYNTDVASTHQFDSLPVGYSRNGLEATFEPSNFEGGGKNYYMDNSVYEGILEKNKNKVGVKISSDALELIRLSIELNIDMLIKETLKKYKLKNSISVNNVKNTLKNAKYVHFTKSANEIKVNKI